MNLSPSAEKFYLACILSQAAKIAQRRGYEDFAKEFREYATFFHGESVIDQRDLSADEVNIILGKEEKNGS